MQTDEMTPDWHARVDHLRDTFEQQGVADDGTDSDAVYVSKLDAAWRAEWWQKHIPVRFRDAHVDQLTGDLQQLRDWDGASNVVILGNVGSGKTHAAVALARTAHDLRGQRVMVRSSAQLLDELRPGGDPQAMGRAQEAAVLVLDDLGTERPTDWTAERLFIVVDERWKQCRPTIATSNLDAARLEQAIGPRMWSRLSDGALRVRVTEGDRRAPQR